MSLPPLELQYKIEDETVKRKLYSRINEELVMGAATVIGGGGLADAIFWISGDVPNLFVGGIAGGVLMYAWLTWQNLRLRRARKGPAYVRTIGLDDWGVTWWDAWTRVGYSWKSLSSWKDEANYVTLWQKHRTAFIIPKQPLDESSLAQLRDFLSHHLKLKD